MASVTQPNSAQVDALPQSKNFLEDGKDFNEENIDKMTNAIKNSDNLDQFLSNINRQNVNQSQYSEEAATAAASPTKMSANQLKSPRSGGYNMRLYDPFQYLNSSDEEECTFQPQINKNASKLSKRVYAGDTNEQLYRYHTERTLKKQEFVEIHNQNINTKTALHKSNKNSIKMIIKKLQTAINTLVVDAEEEGQEGVLTFEGLGNILHRLGIFQNLEFNNNNKDGERSSLNINYARVKPERLAKEIAFHENFWKICAVPTLVADKVPSELVSKLLTVLVESKTATAEAGSFLTEIVNAALVNVGVKGEEEKTPFECQKEEKDLWSLTKVVSEFRQLFENKTQFMAIYNKTPTMLNPEEISSKYYQNSHVPQINKKSVRLDATKGQAKMAGHLEEHVPNLTQKDLQTRNTRLYKYSQYLHKKKGEKLEKRITAELEPCTFVPKTTKYKRPAHADNYDSVSPDRLGYFTQALAGDSTVNRHLMLYEVAKTYKEKLQQKSYAHKMKEESTEMAECSFKPRVKRLNENSPTRNTDFYDGVPRGFKKNVERLHLGAYQKESREAELAKVPRGENYHKNKELDFTPPTFLQRPKIKKDEVLVYVDVSIGPGKTGRIGIHKGDNAKSLAKNFARTYSLNATMRESLEKLLQSYIDSYFAQPAQQEIVEQPQEAQETDRHEDEHDENGEEEEEDDGEEEESDEEEN